MRYGISYPLTRAGRWEWACLLLALLSFPSNTQGQTCIVTTPIGAGAEVATAVAIQSDRKIVLGGYSFSGASDDFALVRYNRDLTLDLPFVREGS